MNIFQRIILVGIQTFLFYPISYSQENTIHWEGQFKVGVVYNIPSPLRIKQEGYADINLNARYESEPLKFPIYGAILIGRWRNNKLWEFETLHHKLYLKNKPSEVSQLTISHGFNLVTINRGWQFDNSLILRVGLGIVLTHPESEIRGLKWDESKGIFGLGYYISGPTSSVSLEKKWIFWNRLIVSSEALFSASYANIPIVNGRAHVSNFALHGLIGLGYRFK